VFIKSYTGEPICPSLLKSYILAIGSKEELRVGKMYATDLKTLKPAILRDQAAEMVKKIRTWNCATFPTMTQKWWTQLHEALNANETLEVLAKEAVDDYDYRMKEGLAILQILIM